MHGGTLLGSVRGRDFIAWDDDVDVVMPRESFDRLRSMRAELAEGGYCFSFPEDSNFFYDFIPGFYCKDFSVKQKTIGHKGDELIKCVPPKIDIFVLDECNGGINHRMTCLRLISKYLLARGHRETKVKLDVKTTLILRPFLWSIAKVFEVLGARKRLNEIIKRYDDIAIYDDEKNHDYVYLSNDQPWFLLRVYPKKIYKSTER